MSNWTRARRGPIPDCWSVAVGAHSRRLPLRLGEDAEQEWGEAEPVRSDAKPAMELVHEAALGCPARELVAVGEA